MDIISTESITRIGGEKIAFHETAIVYIQSFLQPYAEALDSAQDTDGIVEWVPMVFPGDLGERIVSAVQESIASYDVEQCALDLPAIAKATVMECLVRELIPVTQDTRVFPWDIHSIVSNHELLSTMFDITPLAISVVVEGECKHTVSEEFVAGVLVFCAVGEVNFDVKMFGIPINPEDMVGESSKFSVNDKHNFSVNVDERIYGFNTAEFMRGIITGATTWCKVDHHDYWKDLVSYTIDETTGDKVVTPLTI